MDNSRKRLLVAGSLFIAFVLLIALSFIRQSSLSATIDITAVPSASHITINGGSVGPGKVRVKPGQYTIVVSLSGFSSVTQIVTVGKSETKQVGIVLSSNSSQTANWYITHPKDEQMAEGISSQDASSLYNQSLSKAPLIQYLPFVGGGLEFRVDYGNAPGSTAGNPVIYITAASNQGQQAGLKWIQSLGYDVANYNIQYVTAAVKPLQ